MTNVPQLSCHAGYTGYWFGCYKRHLEKRSWDEAQSKCESEGANLVSIMTSAENAAVQLIAQTDNAPVWLGGRAQNVRLVFHSLRMCNQEFSRSHVSRLQEGRPSWFAQNSGKKDAFFSKLFLRWVCFCTKLELSLPLQNVIWIWPQDQNPGIYPTGDQELQPVSDWHFCSKPCTIFVALKPRIFHSA